MTFKGLEWSDFLSQDQMGAEGWSSHLLRSSERTARLVLQAALREGLLKDCSQHWEDGVLTLRGQGEELNVRGNPAGFGDRFFLLPGGLRLSLDEFLSRLRNLAGGGAPAAWDRLTEELSQANLTQAVCYALSGRRSEPKGYLDFEAWTPEGHNLHPGAKTRSGFTAQDQLKYAPELAEFVDLPWLAVHKDLLELTGPLNHIFVEDDENWALPVHPWQRDNVLPQLYAQEWSRGLLRDLDREPVRCRLCTSLRTVVPQRPDLPVLKTSVGCLMTSTDRSMSRYTVLQGPIYSEYLRRVFQQRPDFAKTVEALEESGGFSWRNSGEAERDRNLSLLFRQRPPRVERGVAVPCSTLPQPSWSGESTYFGHFFGKGKGPRHNFQAYLNLLIPFHLELYLNFGIALEAHLQNCVVVWTEEGPEKLWVRDWGGLRADGIKVKEFAPDLFSRLSIDSVTLSYAKAAEKKLIACLYCNHLTEVVAGVSQALKIAEDELWQAVFEVTSACFDGHHDSTLKRRLLYEDWPVKCLLKMRLGLGGSGDVYWQRANPLRVFQD